MDFSGIAKVIRTIIIWTLLVLFLGSILDISFEKWVKFTLPKPSIKIEESASRETPVKTVYLIDKKEVTAEEYFKWAEKELKKTSQKPPRKGKGLKFTGSGRTRSTTKGDIHYGNGR